MSNFWKASESIHRQAAVGKVWQGFLGENYEMFRATFLQKAGQATSFPCSHHCGCTHEVVIHDDATIVAVCQCEDFSCEDIHLEPADLTIFELNWNKLGRVLAKTFGFRACETELGIKNVLQIATYTQQAIPVVLSIQHNREQFKRAISELVGYFQKPFLLFVPTTDLIDGASQKMLKNVKAALIGIESFAILLPQGILKANKPIDELLAPLKGIIEEPLPEDVALRAFHLVSKLNDERPRKKPNLLSVFKDYCGSGMSASQIAKKFKCSKATVIHRMQDLEEKLGQPLKELRKYSPFFNRVEESLHSNKAKSINRKSAIYGHNYDEE